MKNETAKREIESLDYYLQNHTDDYSEESHTAMMMAIKALEQEPSGDLISRNELLKAMDTWDKFGVDDTNSLFRLDNLSLPHYVPYIHYDDVVKCIKGMPSVKQEPKTGYISIDDVMSVFDDFMRGEADEDETDTFLKMLKDRAESEG